MFSERFTFRQKRGRDHDKPEVDRSSIDATVSQSPPPVTSSWLALGLNPSGQLFSSTSTQSTTSSGTGDSDPLGLKVVYRPEGDHIADIIFVHGLGGGSRRTWSKDRNPDLFWPLRFLSAEPGISETRISTFGYNSNFRGGSKRSRVSILDFAKSLLFDLKYGQDESVGQQDDLGMGDRPIVFVVHSMGGLVVKEAYIQGQNDPVYRSIIEAVSGIIFLSTPHRGSNLAEILNRILRASPVSSSTQFVSELASGSQTLQRLNEQFRHVAPKLDVVSFYETRPTTVFSRAQVMILEKDSSVLGYPGEVSMPLEGDHHDVCKYESRADPGYVAVRNVLKSLIQNGKQKARPRTFQNKTSETPVEELLSVTESPERDYSFFRDRWTEGTCSWILDHPGFADWMGKAQSGPKIHWVYGTAGSGKSVLASFVVNHLVQSGISCQYFFVRSGEESKRATGTILRSLACQLANSTPAYAERLRQLGTAASSIKDKDYQSTWRILFRQSLLPLDISHPICWVVDGLDEADDPESLLRTLAEFRSSKISLRILIVSRHTHDISISFQKLGRQQLEVRKMSVEGHNDDFCRYIDHEMCLAGGDAYKEEITCEILQRAQGNFLWVHLAVWRINRCHTKAGVTHALNDLPPGMEALYGRMAGSIQSGTDSPIPTLGERILGWTAFAQRPLTVEELRDALGEEDEEFLEIHGAISDLCGGFVVVDHQDRVVLIHHTAREYLCSKHDQLRLLEPCTTHDKMFIRCITGLMNKRLRVLINQERPPALLGYATSAWAFHLSRGSFTDLENLKILVDFFESPSVLTWIQAAARGRISRSLIDASRCLGNIVEGLRRINDEQSILHRKAVELFTHWATDLVKLVGKYGKPLLRRPDSIYQLIPALCPDSSAISQQFGKKERRPLKISGVAKSTWNDLLARLALPQQVKASSVHASGGRIAVLANGRKSGGIISVYNAFTFEQERQITHPERVLEICAGKWGTRLLSYGYKTTRVWNLSTGDCIKVVSNSATLPIPHHIVFLEMKDVALLASQDRVVRVMDVDKESEGWEAKAQIKEDNLESPRAGLPTCSALSPDGDMIAFGYHRHPITVWQFSPKELVGRCSSMGEITQLAWHPSNSEVFGLNRVGVLFKWNLYEDDASDKVLASAHRLTVSPDGLLVATGDVWETVSVYTTSKLLLIYRLYSRDPILDLSFSADSRRLYDVRWGYGNVWEPDTKIWPSKYSVFAEKDNSFLREQLERIGCRHADAERVTVVSAPRTGSLYLYAMSNGLTVLGEVGYGTVGELGMLESASSVEKVAWSDDGCLMAFSDLSRRMFVKRIVRADPSGKGWHFKDEFRLTTPLAEAFEKLLFHPGGQKLLAVAQTTLLCVDLSTQSVQRLTVPDEDSTMEWMCHPTIDDYILALGVSKCVVYTWNSLTQVAVNHYKPPAGMVISTPTALVSPSGESAAFGQPRFEKGAVCKLTSWTKFSEILLRITFIPPTSPARVQYLLFSADAIQLDVEESAASTDETRSPDGLTYIRLPPELSNRIREPLGILSNRRLLFLDADRWICTWRMQTAPLAQMVKGIYDHYFLPEDWLTPMEEELCTAMADGTLLCIRNNEVVTVQCASITRR